tara:strand:+ start:2042 stop:2725 length:684 start_codon:yes stop_codon:yes gene_type:complete
MRSDQSQVLLVADSTMQFDNYIQSWSLDKIGQKVDVKNHIDCMYFDFSQTPVPSADEIREGLANIWLRPRVFDYRLVIITHVQNINTQTGNALLKIIEEPPKHAEFCLLTSHIDRVLPTIRSRCIINSLNNQQSAFSGMGRYISYLEGTTSKQSLVKEMLVIDQHDAIKDLGALIYHILRTSKRKETMGVWQQWIKLSKKVNSRITWNAQQIVLCQIDLLNQLKKFV